MLARDSHRTRRVSLAIATVIAFSDFAKWGLQTIVSSRNQRNAEVSAPALCIGLLLRLPFGTIASPRSASKFWAPFDTLKGKVRHERDCYCSTTALVSFLLLVES